ncbi:MAG TPA: hypothetical protein VMT22_20350 [Terriglobales bacterium]|jgi:hypothetical protein|nr:hypothetical protein [Terriglobales bacterium]
MAAPPLFCGSDSGPRPWLKFRGFHNPFRKAWGKAARNKGSDQFKTFKFFKPFKTLDGQSRHGLVREQNSFAAFDLSAIHDISRVIWNLAFSIT